MKLRSQYLEIDNHKSRGTCQAAHGDFRMGRTVDEPRCPREDQVQRLRLAVSLAGQKVLRSHEEETDRNIPFALQNN